MQKFVNVDKGTMRIPIAYAAVLATLAVLDTAWITLVALGQFQSALGSALRTEPNFYAAIAFYLVYAGGVVFLAVRPALSAGSAATALVNGAVLGLTAYATYDLTSLTIINGYTPGLALLDMAWGTVLSMVAAMAGYAAAARMSRASS